MCDGEGGREGGREGGKEEDLSSMEKEDVVYFCQWHHSLKTTRALLLSLPLALSLPFSPTKDTHAHTHTLTHTHTNTNTHSPHAKKHKHKIIGTHPPPPPPMPSSSPPIIPPYSGISCAFCSFSSSSINSTTPVPTRAICPSKMFSVTPYTRERGRDGWMRKWTCIT